VTKWCSDRGIHRDAKRYPNPDEFDPSRYANDFLSLADSTMSPDVSKRDQFNFGAGRRVCQGMHIADRSLFLSISRLLWAFRFDKEVDELGNEITPDPSDVNDGLLIIPHPFPMKVTPRNAARTAAIKQAWADCQPLLNAEGQWREVPEGMSFQKYEPKAEEQ
jgi:hypothetical protein